jgi:hypothetical protein
MADLGMFSFLPKGFLNLSPLLQTFIGFIMVVHLAGFATLGIMHFTTKQEPTFKGKLT